MFSLRKIILAVFLCSLSGISQASSPSARIIFTDELAGGVWIRSVGLLLAKSTIETLCSLRELNHSYDGVVTYQQDVGPVWVQVSSEMRRNAWKKFGSSMARTLLLITLAVKSAPNFKPTFIPFYSVPYFHKKHGVVKSLCAAGLTVAGCLEFYKKYKESEAISQQNRNKLQELKEEWE